MYDVNGRPPIETSTRRAASFGVTVTSIATDSTRAPRIDMTDDGRQRRDDQSRASYRLA